MYAYDIASLGSGRSTGQCASKSILWYLDDCFREILYDLLHLSVFLEVADPDFYISPDFTLHAYVHY